MTNKTTKKEFFGMLKAMVNEVKPTNMDELLGFIDHEVELIDRKASNRKAGTSKKAIENNNITNLILSELTLVGKTTITNLLKKSQVLANYVTEAGDSLSNQKISALLKPLLKSELNPTGTVIRTTDKKVVLFSIVK